MTPSPFPPAVEGKTPEAWRDWASCLETDPELWHPEKGRCDQVTAAKAICAGCPVRTECLEYALDQHEMHGIYGGLTAHERRRLRPTRPTPVDIQARRDAVSRILATDPSVTSPEVAARLGCTVRQALRDMSILRQASHDAA
jgi:WhiB family redox-sensing transcriptional regulator